MTEEEKIKLEKEVIINIIDGEPCIYLPNGIIGKKLPPPVLIPFNFGTMQEHRKRNTMPDVLKELRDVFQNSFKISYFELPGPKKKEDKKDDNKERERKTEESI